MYDFSCTHTGIDYAISDPSIARKMNIRYYQPMLFCNLRQKKISRN